MPDVDHGEIMLFLGRLDGKLDGLIGRQDIANGRTSKLEDRVNDLESTRDKQSGGWKVGSILGAGISTFVYFILNKFVPGN